MKYLKKLKSISKTKSGKFLIFIDLFLICITIFASLYFAIEIFKLTGTEKLSLYRNIGYIVLFIIQLIIILLITRTIKMKKKIGIFIIIISCLIYSLSIIYVTNKIITKLDNTINKISEDKITYSSSIVTLVDSNINDVTDIKNMTIGIIADEKSIDGYEIANEILDEKLLKEKNEITKFNNFPDIIQALYDEKINVAMLPTNYPILLSSNEDFENVNEKTKVIYTKDKSVKNTDLVIDDEILKKPFSVLIMGVDSIKGSVETAASNGDALMIGTFNPITLNATLVGIPRDTYTYLPTSGRTDKITHAGWYGANGMKKAVDKMFDIKTSFYVTTNFQGLVSIVDALKGISVYVEIQNSKNKFCEQDSKRRFGKYLICLNEGVQTLNGEQALAYARHRKTLNRGDIDRSDNQKKVIEGIVNKVKNIKSVDEVNKLLDAISGNFSTNLTKEQMLSFYDLLEKIILSNTTNSSIINLQKMRIKGYDKRIFSASTGSPLYYYVPYKQSIKEISDAMKINLGIKKLKPIKEFSFSINKLYEQTEIGNGNYSQDSSYETLPNFVGKSVSYVQNYCNNHGITLNITKIPQINSSQETDVVISQNQPSKKLLSQIKSLTITIYEKVIIDIIDNPDTNPDTDPEITDPDTNPDTDPEITDPDTNPDTDPEITDPDTNPDTDPEITDPEI
ncbi:MAG: LCP family protein [Bacilli bacterium]